MRPTIITFLLESEVFLAGILPNHIRKKAMLVLCVDLRSSPAFKFRTLVTCHGTMLSCHSMSPSSIQEEQVSS